MAYVKHLETSCSICNGFQGRRPIESSSKLSQARRAGTRHHKAVTTWNELERSAESCYSCDILLRGSRGCFKHQGIEEGQVSQISLCFYNPYALDVVETESSLGTLEFLLDGGRRFTIEMFATFDEACPIPDSWDYFYTSSRIVPRPDSGEALEIIKKWLGDCVDEHSDSS